MGSGNFAGSAGGFDYAFTNTSNTLGVVPEPSTWALLALAGIAASAARRRLNARCNLRPQEDSSR